MYSEAIISLLIVFCLETHEAADAEKHHGDAVDKAAHGHEAEHGHEEKAEHGHGEDHEEHEEHEEENKGRNQRKH